MVVRKPRLSGSDAEPVDVCPSAVVCLDGGAGAEGSYLGAYPFAFLGLEGVAQLLEVLSVEAIAEVTHHHEVVTTFTFGYLLAVATELDAQIDGRVGQGDGGVDLFGRAFFGFGALYLREHQSFVRILKDEAGVIEAHYDEACAFALVLADGLERELHRGGEVLGRRLLKEQVGYVPQVFVVLYDRVGVEADEALVAGIVGPLLVDVGVPLPLGREGVAVELVTLLRGADGVGLAYVGLLVCQYGLAASVAVLVFSDDGPSVHPLHGLEVNEAAIGAYVLEMEEPVFTRRRVHPRALMGAVDGRVALCQHGSPFIGAVDVLRTEYDLPARGYAAGRVEDVVIVALLVELGAFACLVSLMAVEDDARGGDGLRGFGVQFADGDDALQLGTAARIGMYQIDFAVVIPQGAGVDDAFAGLYEYRLCPRPLGVFGFHHEGALVGVAPEDVEFAVVVADGGGPYAVAMFRPFGRTFRSQFIGDGRADEGPIHQVLGVEDLEARQAVEARRGHVEVVAHAAGIGVGVVGIEDGVLVGAVSLIGHPYLRYVVFRLLGGQWQADQQAES